MDAAAARGRTGSEQGHGQERGILLLGVGDTHGDFGPLFAAARREPEARALLQVGDLTAGKPGRDARPDDDPALLATLPLPLVWVHGNHEHWAALGIQDDGSRAADTPAPGHHLWPGTDYVVPGTQIRIVGLPGNYAPNWYERRKPFPGDRVRHFNRADLEAVAAFERPAVLLMHETFRGHSPGRIGLMGIPVLSALVRRTRPSVCLTGHHHTYVVAEHGTTLAIALPLAEEGYVRLWFTPVGERLGWEMVPLEQAE
jgi:hypothetical protein